MRKSYIWAAGIAAVLGIWMASPRIVAIATGGNSHGEAESVSASGGSEPAQERLFRVRTRTFTAEPYVAAVVAQGTTEASANVEARARSNGIALNVPVRQGQEVRAGDVLCEIDFGSWKTDMLRAEAEKVSASRDLAATEKLAGQNFATQSELMAQRARKKAADAAVASLDLEKDHKTVKAPVDGVLIQKPAEAGTLLNPGDLCATVSVLDPLLVVVAVSERQVGYLVEGYAAEAKLATGETVQGRVTFIAKSADATTRTFRVELEVPNAGARMRQGVTAALRAQLRPVMAHKIPGSILSLNDEGKLGVRIVKPDSTTEFVFVTILEQVPEAMWVMGLPASADVITVGQDFVKDGEKVEAVVETADAGQ